MDNLIFCRCCGCWVAYTSGEDGVIILCRRCGPHAAPNGAKISHWDGEKWIDDSLWFDEEVADAEQ